MSCERCRICVDYGVVFSGMSDVIFLWKVCIEICGQCCDWVGRVLKLNGVLICDFIGVWVLSVGVGFEELC